MLFLARSLSRAGAERQLVSLVTGLAARGHAVLVAVLYGGGPLQAEITNAGIRCVELGKGGRWQFAVPAWRFARLIRTERPQLIHGYLESANILSVLAKAVLPGVKAVWGVRSSNLDLRDYDTFARILTAAARHLSRFADLVIVNSQAGSAYLREHGYAAATLIVIPNGIDSARYRPDPERREAQRRQWSIAPADLLVGIVGRLDPMKDYPTFLAAAGRVAMRTPNARFVCVGSGPDGIARKLRTMADTYGLADKILWAGEVDDTPSAYNALDVCCSSSHGEGFSNALAEAMSCGTPCVATDVGDSRLVLGETGAVVRPRDPAALADAVCLALDRIAADPVRWKTAARKRIVDEFNLDALLDRTEGVLEGLYVPIRRPGEAACGNQ